MGPGLQYSLRSEPASSHPCVRARGAWRRLARTPRQHASATAWAHARAHACVCGRLACVPACGGQRGRVPGLRRSAGCRVQTTRAPRRLDRCDPDDVARAWFGSAQRGAQGRRWLAAGARAADGWFRPSGRAPGRSPCGTRVGSAAALDGRQFNPDRADPVSASIHLRASACGRGARSAVGRVRHRVRVLRGNRALAQNARVRTHTRAGGCQCVSCASVPGAWTPLRCLLPD